MPLKIKLSNFLFKTLFLKYYKNLVLCRVSTSAEKGNCTYSFLLKFKTKSLSRILLMCILKGYLWHKTLPILLLRTFVRARFAWSDVWYFLHSLSLSMEGRQKISSSMWKMWLQPNHSGWITQEVVWGGKIPTNSLYYWCGQAQIKCWKPCVHCGRKHHHL